MQTRDPAASGRASSTGWRFADGPPDGDGSRAALQAVEVRNGLPLAAYRYRARRGRWARAAIERAEAEFGRPELARP